MPQSQHNHASDGSIPAQRNQSQNVFNYQGNDRNVGGNQPLPITSMTEIGTHPSDSGLTEQALATNNNQSAEMYALTHDFKAIVQVRKLTDRAKKLAVQQKHLSVWEQVQNQATVTVGERSVNNHSIIGDVNFDDPRSHSPVSQPQLENTLTQSAGGNRFPKQNSAFISEASSVRGTNRNTETHNM